MLEFEVSVTGRADGTPMAAYIRVRRGRIACTREIEPDVLLAHYDTIDNLLGLEILAPIRIGVLIQQGPDESLRSSFRSFVKANVPKDLLRAA
jgi:hypothetical protein